jgi:Ca2+-binding EF-hand superfamily protein
MLFTGIQFRWTDETAKNRRDDLQQQLQQSTIYTAIDDNLDGVLQKAELKSSLLKPLNEHFAEFDANHDGALDPKEFGGAMQMLQQAEAAEEAKLEKQHHEDNAKVNPPSSSR